MAFVHLSTYPTLVCMDYQNTVLSQCQLKQLIWNKVQLSDYNTLFQRRTKKLQTYIRSRPCKGRLSGWKWLGLRPKPSKIYFIQNPLLSKNIKRCQLNCLLFEDLVCYQTFSKFWYRRCSSVLINRNHFNLIFIKTIHQQSTGICIARVCQIIKTIFLITFNWRNHWIPMEYHNKSTICLILKLAKLLKSTRLCTTWTSACAFSESGLKDPQDQVILYRVIYRRLFFVPLENHECNTYNCTKNDLKLIENLCTWGFRIVFQWRCCGSCWRRLVHNPFQLCCVGRVDYLKTQTSTALLMNQ